MPPSSKLNHSLFNNLLTRAENQPQPPSQSHFFHYSPPPPITQRDSIEHAIIQQGLSITSLFHLRAAPVSRRIRPPSRRLPQSAPVTSEAAAHAAARAAAEQERLRRTHIEDAIQINPKRGSRSRNEKPISNSSDDEIASPFRRKRDISPVSDDKYMLDDPSPVIMRRRPQREPSVRLPPELPPSPERSGKPARVSKTVASPARRTAEKNDVRRNRKVEKGDAGDPSVQTVTDEEYEYHRARGRKEGSNVGEDADAGGTKRGGKLLQGDRTPLPKVSRCGRGDVGSEIGSIPKRSPRLRLLADQKEGVKDSPPVRSTRSERKSGNSVKAGGPESDVSTDVAMTLDKTSTERRSLKKRQTEDEGNASSPITRKQSMSERPRKGDRSRRFRRRAVYLSDSESDAPSVIDLTDDVNLLDPEASSQVYHTKSPVLRNSIRAEKRRSAATERVIGGREPSAESVKVPSGDANGGGGRKTVLSGKKMTTSAVPATSQKKRAATGEEKALSTRETVLKSTSLDEKGHDEKIVSSAAEATGGAEDEPPAEKDASPDPRVICAGREGNSAKPVVVSDEVQSCDMDKSVERHGRSASADKGHLKDIRSPRKLRSRVRFEEAKKDTSPGKRDKLRGPNPEVFLTDSTPLLENQVLVSQPECLVADDVIMLDREEQLESSRRPKTRSAGRKRTSSETKASVQVRWDSGDTRAAKPRVSSTGQRGGSAGRGTKRGKSTTKDNLRSILSMDEEDLKVMVENCPDNELGPQSESVGRDDTSFVMGSISKRLQLPKAEDLIGGRSSLCKDDEHEANSKRHSTLYRAPPIVSSAEIDLFKEDQLGAENAKSQRRRTTENKFSLDKSHDSLLKSPGYHSAAIRVQRRSPPESSGRKRERHTLSLDKMTSPDEARKKIPRWLTSIASEMDTKSDDCRKKILRWLADVKNRNRSKSTVLGAPFSNLGSDLNDKTEQTVHKRKSCFGDLRDSAVKALRVEGSGNIGLFENKSKQDLDSDEASKQEVSDDKLSELRAAVLSSKGGGETPCHISNKCLVSRTSSSPACGSLKEKVTKPFSSRAVSERNANAILLTKRSQPKEASKQNTTCTDIDSDETKMPECAEPRKSTPRPCEYQDQNSSLQATPASSSPRRVRTWKGFQPTARTKGEKGQLISRSGALPLVNDKNLACEDDSVANAHVTRDPACTDGETKAKLEKNPAIHPDQSANNSNYLPTKLGGSPRKPATEQTGPRPQSKGRKTINTYDTDSKQLSLARTIATEGGNGVAEAEQPTDGQQKQSNQLCKGDQSQATAASQDGPWRSLAPSHNSLPDSARVTPLRQYLFQYGNAVRLGEVSGSNEGGGDQSESERLSPRKSPVLIQDEISDGKDIQSPSKTRASLPGMKRPRSLSTEKLKSSDPLGSTPGPPKSSALVGTDDDESQAFVEGELKKSPRRSPKKSPRKSVQGSPIRKTKTKTMLQLSRLEDSPVEPIDGNNVPQWDSGLPMDLDESDFLEIKKPPPCIEETKSS